MNWPLIVLWVFYGALYGLTLALTVRLHKANKGLHRANKILFDLAHARGVLLQIETLPKTVRQTPLGVVRGDDWLSPN